MSGWTLQVFSNNDCSTREWKRDGGGGGRARGGDGAETTVDMPTY